MVNQFFLSIFKVIHYLAVWMSFVYFHTIPLISKNVLCISWMCWFTIMVIPQYCTVEISESFLQEKKKVKLYDSFFWEKITIIRCQICLNFVFKIQSKRLPCCPVVKTVLPKQGVQVKSLIGKLRSHMPWGQKIKKNNNKVIFTL